jgi:Tol biopolymer transport system component/DNA-binding winged helix-turn-helix (wHTH) protein
MSSPGLPHEYRSSPEAQRIRFDRYQLDLSAGELRKEGRKVRLQAQPFQLLVLLLRNSGKVVSREDVKRELWPGDTFVDFDHGLAAAVNKIREALCDSAEKPKFVETIPRRGYRFIGKVEPEPPVEIRTRLEEVPPHALDVEAPATEEVTGVHRESRARTWALGPALVLLGAGVAAAFVLLLDQKKPEAPAEQWTMTQFTSYPGVTNAPAISPDGSRIAFGLDPKNSGESDLYVKALGGEALLQLTHHPSKWISPAWSPDGTQIAFMRLADADTGIYVVPALGGPEQKLLATNTPYDLAAPLNWSPDGKWITYADQPKGTFGNLMYLFSMETRESHLFYHDPACVHEGNLTFSNDGKQVAWFCVKKLDAIDLMVGDPAGKSRRFVRTVHLVPSGLVWAPDDTKVITPQQGEQSELFEIRLSDGAMKRTAAAAGQLHANWPAMSAKTGAMAWDAWRYRIDLLQADLLDPRKRVTPILESSKDENHASYSPDGKHVAFCSNRSGTWAVWIGDADGSNLTMVSRGEDVGPPRWSPDSRHIVYHQFEVDKQFIYLVDIAERVPHRLDTRAQEPGSPFWSRDGQSIYFQDEASFLEKYWQCSLHCEKNETLVREGVKATSMQPTEDWSYWYYMDVGGDAQKLCREKMTEGRVSGREEIVEVPALTDFFVGKNGIYFVSSEKRKTLEYFDFATHKIKNLLTTDKEISSGFWVSADGRTALLPQWYDYHQDIMLAEPKR